MVIVVYSCLVVDTMESDFSIKKQFLIQSKKDNILNHYEFSPKVLSRKRRN